MRSSHGVATDPRPELPGNQTLGAKCRGSLAYSARNDILLVEICLMIDRLDGQRRQSAA